MSETLPITKGAPMPQREAWRLAAPLPSLRGVTHTLRAMEVGDSFDVPGDGPPRNIYGLAYRLGVRIAVRRVGGVYRVWRVA